MIKMISQKQIEDLDERIRYLERVQLLTFIYMVVNLLVVFGLWLMIGAMIK